METKENINTDPKGGQSAVDTQKGTPKEPDKGNQQEATPTRPDWLKENFKSTEDQAKAYPEAEKAMTRAQQEAARVKQELEQLKLQVNPPAGADRSDRQPSAETPLEIPFEVRERIERKYPGVPAEQIVAIADILNVSLAPIKDSIYGSKVESVKEQFAKDKENYPYYERFKGEIETTLNRYPIEKRTDPTTLQTCYSWVVNRHVKELQEEWKEEGKKAVSGSPAQVPAFAGDKGAPPVSPGNGGTAKFTDDQKNMAQKMGITVEDLVKYNKDIGRYR